MQTATVGMSLRIILEPNENLVKVAEYYDKPSGISAAIDALPFSFTSMQFPL